MTREELIECLSRFFQNDPWREAPSYRILAERALDALTAAGMVVVKKSELENLWRKAPGAANWLPSHKAEFDETIRAMTEAANG